MKKVVLTFAIVLGSLTAFATPTPANQEVVISIVMQDEYTEVALEEVPAAITEALKAAYPTAVLDKAYINAEKKYKLDVTVGDKKGNLFADENGKWIQ